MYKAIIKVEYQNRSVLNSSLIKKNLTKTVKFKHKIRVKKPVILQGAETWSTLKNY